MVDLTHVKWLPNRFGEQVDDAVRRQALYGEVSRSQSSAETNIAALHQQSFLGICRLPYLSNAGDSGTKHVLGRATPPNSEKEKLVVACEVFSPSSEGILIEFSKFFLHETDSQKRNKTTIHAPESDAASCIEESAGAAG